MLKKAIGARSIMHGLGVAMEVPEGVQRGKATARAAKAPQKKSVPTGSTPGAAPMHKMSAKKALHQILRKQAGAAGRSFGEAAAWGAGLAGTALGVGLTARGVGSVHTKMKAARMFKDLQRRYPEIKRHKDAEKYFDLIVAYAPSLLRHHAAVGDFLKRQLEYPISSVEFLKQLADLEATVAKTNREGLGMQLGQDVARYTQGSM